MPVVIEHTLRERHAENGVGLTAESEEDAVVLERLPYRVRQTARRVVVTVKHIGNRITGLLATKTGPDDLYTKCYQYRSARHAEWMPTAVTLGFSTHDSMMDGPTECATTMVLLFAAATAWMRLSALCHKVRLFLSPKLPSTVIYPSPESELTNTI